ncbi:MAG: hypothetical protein A2138_09295 [Deltaproteobacteria bacterium RBG_16_71_12]|nr:MAG: hypothetical protein A2138_09295 [Deltaproteobacteria bacterium RBG_16_71_12]
MTAKKPKTALCPACGKGTLEYRARAGRSFHYKGFEYPIASKMKLVECDTCGEMPMTPAEVAALEGPIAELHRERMAGLVDDALCRLEGRMTIGEIERALHLSQGYLARARTKGEPSFPLAALLHLLAEHPKALGELQRLTV